MSSMDTLIALANERSAEFQRLENLPADAGIGRMIECLNKIEDLTRRMNECAKRATDEILQGQ